MLLQAFCFQNESSGKLVHAGVLEFTSSEPNVAFLPQWMFDHLEVVEGIHSVHDVVPVLMFVFAGGEVKFEYVDLPKGTFVQLQPVSSAWLVSKHTHITYSCFIFLLELTI